MKHTLRQLFLSTLERLELKQVMRRKIACDGAVLEVGDEQIDLSPFKKILGVAIGKAAYPMAAAFSEIIQPRVVSGIAVSSAANREPPPYFIGYQGGHPYPDAESMHAADVALTMLSDLKPYHLVVFLLSGGGSAICEKPISADISLQDLRELYRLLVTGGANIVDMNVLRKHFSAVKGGRLAQRARPGRQLTLYVSDVPPGQPATVASGPTMADESTIDDCYRIMQRLQLRSHLPASIASYFDQRRIPETPKPSAPAFQSASWHCLLDNQDALDHLAAEAANQGWVVETDLSVDDWPVGRAADRLLSRLRELQLANKGRTVALLTGGELSCPVTGDGAGGRNQAFVLDCARKIAGENIAVLSAGTDGMDGNSSAAGAVADGTTLSRATRLGLDAGDFYQRSDSFRFFSRLGDELVTGPTGNNVRDLRILVGW